MNREQIIQHKQRRYKRALTLASRVNSISTNGQPHTFYVRSQTNPAQRYLSATSQAEAGPRCDCQDWQDFGRHQDPVIPCKHIIAAAITEIAREWLKSAPREIADAARQTLQPQAETDELLRLKLSILDAVSRQMPDEAKIERKRQDNQARKNGQICPVELGTLPSCAGCGYVHLGCQNYKAPAAELTAKQAYTDLYD